MSLEILDEEEYTEGVEDFEDDPFDDEAAENEKYRSFAYANTIGERSELK